MAILDELITQIENADLRERIAAEVKKLMGRKQFGLVFEEHLPECTPLWGIPVKRGAKVALRSGQVSDFYTVLKLENGVATCLKKDKSATAEFKVKDLVTVAEFGEAIYPYLKYMDSVCNAPDSDLWHMLIEADNYHALQLLEYLYAGKVDCIYIDPPYNTGARDWKYNNDYVDGTDQYRHSKWLSMMQKRLRLAKRLLDPQGSVLIVTIDEKEYLHLGCLLEDIFSEARMQMVSITMNHAGTGRKSEFARVNEFAFYVFMGERAVLPEFEYGKGHVSVLWDVLRRSELSNTRERTQTQFYPIFIDDATGRIVSVGEPLQKGIDRASVLPPKGCTAVFPVRDDGIETMWGCRREELLKRIAKGYVRVGAKTPSKPQAYPISYLKSGAISDIESGKAVVEGRGADGSVRAYYRAQRKKNPPTVIESALYDARIHGSGILDRLIGRERFSFPKSLYAVRDCLKFAVADKRDALIVDFFAGSGTTLHAVNLLNAEDGGNRRCILVTNNEVSEAESRALAAQGCHPGDEAWEELGIARHVTWPRTVCSIEGHDINGEPMEGTYAGCELPMADGFKANAVYFKLGFLDKNAVSLGKHFKEMLPTLWMMAGAVGECPKEAEEGSGMLLLPKNRFAVLMDERKYRQFADALCEHPEIETAFLVTDSESGFHSMSDGLPTECYRLYSDYLEHFRANSAVR